MDLHASASHSGWLLAGRMNGRNTQLIEMIKQWSENFKCVCFGQLQAHISTSAISFCHISFINKDRIHRVMDSSPKESSHNPLNLIHLGLCGNLVFHPNTAATESWNALPVVSVYCTFFFLFLFPMNRFPKSTCAHFHDCETIS